MLAEERHFEIMQRLESRGSVRTVELAAEFEVTDETIRRDLQTLSEGGQLRRMHGGAMRLQERPSVLPFREREVLHVAEKQAIARVARSMIEPGDCIAVDSSTTVAELLPLLGDIELRVITNAQNVQATLVDFPKIELIGLGGRFHRPTLSFHGADCLRAIARYNINKLFVSANGIDLGHGASEVYEPQAIYKEALLSRCEEFFLVLDHGKFGQRADYFFADFNQITAVVTDERAPQEFTKRMKDSGISVHRAELSAV